VRTRCIIRHSGLDPKTHSVCPGFLPLPHQLRVKLQRVHACFCHASAVGQLPAAPKLGRDFSFANIADEAVIGSGDLICSSHASIIRSRVSICILVIFCSCSRVVSTTCSGHPSARAAAAIFSITCPLFFSLLLRVSLRQFEIASKRLVHCFACLIRKIRNQHRIETAGTCPCGFVRHDYVSSRARPQPLLTGTSA